MDNSQPSWRDLPPVTADEANAGLELFAAMGIAAEFSAFIVAMGMTISQIGKGGECENCECPVCNALRATMDGMDLQGYAVGDVFPNG